VICPFGSGLIYSTTSSRISFALSRNGYVPDKFEKTNRARVPVFGILFTPGVGLLFLLPFPSWSKLVGITTSSSVPIYAGAPLALGALRKTKPDLPRVYRLPAASQLAPLAFVFAIWVIYWSGWQTLTTLMVAMLIGYVPVALSYRFELNLAASRIDWSAATWIASYFGDFGPGGIVGGIGIFKHVLDHGGNDALGLVGGLAACAAWSLMIHFVAIAHRLPEPRECRSSGYDRVDRHSPGPGVASAQKLGVGRSSPSGVVPTASTRPSRVLAVGVNEPGT
jgi:hypothetical protein